MTKLIKHDLFDDEMMDFLKEDRFVFSNRKPEVDENGEEVICDGSVPNSDVEAFNNLPVAKRHRDGLLMGLTTLVDDAIDVLDIIKQILHCKNLLNGEKNKELDDVVSVRVGKNGSVEFYTLVKEDD